MQPELAQTVREAAGRADVRDAVRSIYQALQVEIDARRPICQRSGRCCRFDEYGHRLFVTTLELAAFVAELDDRPLQGMGGGCPFQIDGLCAVHPIRPFGCRVFFCDPTATEWQNQQYERFHARIKSLHQVLNVPYFYVEWRQALRALGLGDVGVASGAKAALSLPQLPF